MQFIKNVYFACTFLRISYFPQKVYFPLTSHTPKINITFTLHVC